MTKRQRDVTEGLLGDSGLMLSPFPVATAGSESDGEDDDARDEEGNDGDEDFANDEEDDDDDEGDGDGDGDEGADDGRARGELTEEQRRRLDELNNTLRVPREWRAWVHETATDTLFSLGMAPRGGTGTRGKRRPLAPDFGHFLRISLDGVTRVFVIRLVEEGLLFYPFSLFTRLSHHFAI